MKEIHLAEYNNILKSLNYDTCSIFKINTKQFKDDCSFFMYAKNYFPLDPPISGKVHWDAFSDSLFEGLTLEKSNSIYIFFACK